MSDWQIGDLAVCVDVSDAAEAILEVGKTYEVIGFEVPGEVSPQNSIFNSRGNGLALILAGVRSHGIKPNGRTWAGWKVRRFRKVQHDSREACEEEFVILLKLSKRRVSA